MKTYFGDTNYFFALLRPWDDLHEKAMHLAEATAPCSIVTTDFIFLELARLSSKHGPASRQSTVRAYRDLIKDPNVEIVPASRELMLKAVELDNSRLDKDWDLVDCSSFCIMQDRGLTEALTHDIHFVQAGFTALLRD